MKMQVIFIFNSCPNEPLSTKNRAAGKIEGALARRGRRARSGP